VTSTGGREASGSGGAGGGGRAGSSGAGGAGAAPTFTTIYKQVITPFCGGSKCHFSAPYPQGLNFSTQASAYKGWVDFSTPGDGADSPIFQILYFGEMPPAPPSLSDDNLILVRDWIDAGALND